MLNISTNSVSDKIKLDDFKSYRLLRKSRLSRKRVRIIMLFILLSIVFLFLPWTQNINSKGYVTTRSPEQRPQAIQTVIPGRIEQWYVKEGDFVNKGDTILYLSEVKSEYFDPELITRTREQVDAKTQSITSYEQKIQALKNQYAALEQGLKLKQSQVRNKIVQARNKIAMDSIDLVALSNNFEIAKNQAERIEELYNKGLKSLSDLQEKQVKVQEFSAKVTVQTNKLINQRNELSILTLELTALDQEYRDKLSKSQSEQNSALSGKFESIAETSKLQNQLSNYSERQKQYFITAPQSGYVVKNVSKGIGETLKEGDDVVTIMPESYDLAVEVYVRPLDLPLVHTGSKARLRFDGWPAIVISGWPNASTGIFTGTVVAIDRIISPNGLYRVMLMPDEREKKWPENLAVGTGAYAFVLLKDVPIWYEIWRQLNGFPPEFYSTGEAAKAKEMDKSLDLKSKQ